VVDFLIELLFFFGIIAIVSVNIFLVRIVIIIVRYRKWRQFAVPAVGTVGELIDINGIFNRRNTVTSYRYNCALKIICGNQEFDSIYSEVCKPDSLPLTPPGKTINILWSECDHKYIPYPKTKKELWQVIKQEYNYSLDTALQFIGKRL
jgi:hypothetical protein